MWKYDTNDPLCPNRFPARGVVRSTQEGAGSWIVAYYEDVLNKYKAPLTPLKTVEKAESSNCVLNLKLLEDKYILDSLTDLSNIDVAGCNLTHVDALGFDKLTNLAYINASENLLLLEHFRYFPCLRELELSLNSINKINIKDDDFPNLQVLDLSYNNLKLDDFYSLAKISSLKVLHLTANNFKSKVEEVKQEENIIDRKAEFSSLQILYMDDTKLSDKNIFNILSSLPKLVELNLDNNFLTGIPVIQAKSTKSSDLSQIEVDTIKKVKDAQKKNLEEPKTGESNLLEAETQQLFEKTILPFPNLKSLSLCNNLVEDEKNVVSVANWPSLKQINLNDNPLVNTKVGEPPLLSYYLSKRCGIEVKRSKVPMNKYYVKINDNQKRKVSEIVPKIPKQPVDVLIKAFRESLPSTSPTEDKDKTDKTDNTNQQIPQDEELQGEPVFLTQLNEDEVKSRPQTQQENIDYQSKISVVEEEPRLTDDRFIGYEILLNTKPDEDFIEPVGIQNNVKVLKKMLDREQICLEATAVLDRVKPVYQSKKSVTREKTKISRYPKIHPTKKQQLDVALDSMKNKNKAMVTIELTKALKSEEIYKKEAEQLLKSVQERYVDLNQTD